MTITAAITTRQNATYVGQVWFDHMGNTIEETGHNSPLTASERILALDKALIGRWCYALVKTKVSTNGVDRWVTAILFPDGKTRKLQLGEVSTTQVSEGRFLGFQETVDALKATKISTDLRAAPDVRFPWLGSAAECKLERFATVVAYEKWLIEKVVRDSVLFIFTPGRHVLPPDEPVLFAYVAVIAK